MSEFEWEEVERFEFAIHKLSVVYVKMTNVWTGLTKSCVPVPHQVKVVRNTHRGAIKRQAIKRLAIRRSASIEQHKTICGMKS